MTDIFEGSIIRAARRLDEFLKQVFKLYLRFVFCSHGCFERRPPHSTYSQLLLWARLYHAHY